MNNIIVSVNLTSLFISQMNFISSLNFMCLQCCSWQCEDCGLLFDLGSFFIFCFQVLCRCLGWFHLIIIHSCFGQSSSVYTCLWFLSTDLSNHFPFFISFFFFRGISLLVSIFKFVKVLGSCQNLGLLHLLVPHCSSPDGSAAVRKQPF